MHNGCMSNAPTETEDTMGTTDWHAYIRSARSYAEAQDRIGEAVMAGVNFSDLLALGL